MTVRTGLLRGAEVVRHYGDPAGEYAAATTGVALRDRSHRGRWLVVGRQPGAMLRGVVSGRIPTAWTQGDPGVGVGRAEYSVVLTPKGRIVSDLRLWRVGGSEGSASVEGGTPQAAGTQGGPGDGTGDGTRAGSEGRTDSALPLDDGPLFVDVPAAGVDSLRAHLGRFLPPRLARIDDVSAATAMLTVLGPLAPEVLAREATGLRLEASELAAMADGDLRAVDVGGSRPLVVICTQEVATPAWDLVCDVEVIQSLRRRLESAGARPMGSSVWEALRLEAGRPAFGDDLTDEVIPIEAGIQSRAIDYDKGCYTGQEVIVRLRDRGRVNRHLRRLHLGDGPTPAAGTEVWAVDGGRAVGQVTSGAVSPRLGTLALAYVRREVEPPGPVRIGGPDGPEARVEALA